jgi:hypothetical protein
MQEYSAPGKFEEFEKALAAYARSGRSSGYGERRS